MNDRHKAPVTTRAIEHRISFGTGFLASLGAGLADILTWLLIVALRLAILGAIGYAIYWWATR